MNVICYARFSSAGQGHGSSIQRQTEVIGEYANRHGLTITETITDEGRSAFHAKNKRATSGLGQILSRIQSGHLGNGDTLIIESIDRLSREEVITALSTVTTIIEAGMTIITTMDDQVINKANYQKQWTDIIVTMAKMATAHEESAKKSKRASDTWGIWREKGVMTVSHAGWFNKDKSIRPEREVVVKDIFDMAVKGMGVTRIAAELTTKKTPTFGNGKKSSIDGVWSGNSVLSILKNRAVIGEFQPKSKGKATGEIVQDYYEPIIDHETFNKVQLAIASRKFAGSGSGRPSHNDNIFRGVLSCSSCGRTMLFVKGRFLRCANVASKACDQTKGWHYEPLVEGFLKSVTEIKLVGSVSQVVTALRAEIAKLKSDIETTEKNVEFLLDKMLERDSPAITKRLESEEARIVADRARLAAAEDELLRNNDSMTDMQTQLSGLWDAYRNAEGEEKADLTMRLNALLSRLVRRGVVLQNAKQVLIQLTDGTTYFMQWQLTPSAPLKWKGHRPTDQMEWIVTRRSLDETMLHPLSSGTAV